MEGKVIVQKMKSMGKEMKNLEKIEKYVSIMQEVRMYVHRV